MSENETVAAAEESAVETATETKEVAAATETTPAAVEQTPAAPVVAEAAPAPVETAPPAEAEAATAETAPPAEAEAAPAETAPVAEVPAAPPAPPEEISYHAVENEGEITAIWEMQGQKHLRTIDPRSNEGQKIFSLFTSDIHETDAGAVEAAAS